MNRLFLMRNPDLFQGEKYLRKEKHYFEGWYFKNTNQKESISFIPGINVDGKLKKAFIQVITDDSSYYIDYCLDEFQFCTETFSIRIGNNIFSKDGIHIDIEDNSQNLKIFGDIKYKDRENLKTSLLCPNIMGPFSYIPFMECNHAILCMKNKIQGFISFNDKKINFYQGVGYIEKDWGCSFPKSYVWCQGNCFIHSNASFMLSVANIPFGFFHFQGLICVLIVENQEFKFTTYHHAKIVTYDIDSDSLNIILKKGDYTLHVQSKYRNGCILVAPVKGKMEKDILESITALVTVTLKKGKQILFSDTSTHCGLEIVL